MEALSVTWPQSRLVPRRVSGIEWSANGTARKIAERFVEEYSDLLGAPRGELAWSRDEKSKGRTAVHFRQEWKGIRVSSGSVVIVVSDEGKVLSCSSGVRPVLVPPPEADIGPEAARLAAVGSMGDAAELAKAAPVVTGKLLLVSPDRSQVVYRVLLPTIPTLAKLVVLVDAATGRVVQTLNDVRR
jgi:Zn-dependent metalloprotease